MDIVDQSLSINTSYPESIQTCGGTNRHILYVEILPKGCNAQPSKGYDAFEDPLDSTTVSEIQPNDCTNVNNKINLKISNCGLQTNSEAKSNVLECPCSEEPLFDSIKLECNIEKQVEKAGSKKKFKSQRLNGRKVKQKKKRKLNSIRSQLNKFDADKTPSDSITRIHAGDVHTLFKCKVISSCDFFGEKLSELVKHKKECHKDVKEYQCHQCIYRGATASDLRKHLRQHSGELPYTCKINECNFKAKHKNSLVYHMKKYHPTGDPLPCTADDSCHYTTYLPSNMRLHTLMRHGEGKTLYCELCTYKCYLMGDLKKHQRIHTGDSPYSCTKCSYKCKISSNLKKHFRTHTMEKPFQCEQCEFRSNFINSLKVHKRTHSNERPFACTHCDYKCNHTSNLKKHIQRLHPGSIYSTIRVSQT